MADLRLVWFTQPPPGPQYFGFDSTGQDWQKSAIASKRYIMAHTEKIAAKYGWPPALLHRLDGAWFELYDLVDGPLDVVEAMAKAGPDVRWPGALKWYEWLISVEDAINSAAEQKRLSRVDVILADTIKASAQDVKEKGEALVRASEKVLEKSTKYSTLIAAGAGLVGGALGLSWLQKRLNLRRS